MWVWYFVFRALRRRGFEIDTLAFFLYAGPDRHGFCLPVRPFQTVLRHADRASGVHCARLVYAGPRPRQKLRWPSAIVTIGLLAVTLVFGKTLYGAKTGSISAGSPYSFRSLRKSPLFLRVPRRSNASLRGATWRCLSFGGNVRDGAGPSGRLRHGARLFITFLVIAFLRSGDIASVSFIAAAAAFGGFLVIRAKPYIANRFCRVAACVEYSSGLGYQQTRTMAAASGGLFGLGAGEAGSSQSARQARTWCSASSARRWA